MKTTINLSERLEIIASFITEGATLADIGSDHGYLPCYICLHDENARVIAGEVNDGPFQRTQETVRQYGLSHKIEVRLGDGLNILNDHDDVNFVVIAGMGGPLIKTILEEGKEHLNSGERIIAQPNIDERSVRQWFYAHGYTITNEAIIEENGHIYEIIVGDKKSKKQNMTENQLLFGPHLMNQKSELFYLKWKHEQSKRQWVINQMNRAALPDYKKIEAFKKELTWIEEVLQDDNSYP